MALEFTAVPPVPRGMNLAGPPVFIDDAYCRWMQDVLVDRPGQIRMRGPLSYWYDNTGSIGLDEGEQIIGAAETYIGNASGNPEWRGAVFAADGPTNSTLDGVGSGNSSRVTANGIMRVFKNIGGTKSVVGEVLLPIPFNTQYSGSEKRWINNTIIDAKPALGGGVWIGVIDDVTNSTSSGTSALFYWRGAGLPETSGGSNAGWDVGSATPNVITHASTVSGVEPGMFAFYGSRYLGVVASVSGSSVTLEKNVLAINTSETTLATKVAITYHSVRGFVHQYGRGFANYDGGAYLTSGGIGTDAEGLFKAARLTVGGGSSSNHRAYVYRTSDHQYVARILYSGTVSNTQVEVASGTNERATNAADLLQNESYFIIRNDTTMYNSNLSYDTDYHPINLAYRRPDQKPGALTLPDTTPTANQKYAQPAPGIFNSTYAGRQWFASFNTSDNTYDKHINRVVFSSTDNPENINLCQDASDSIVIPGRENIIGIAGSNAGLLVFVETKTYIIRGTNRQNFSLEELYPDGCISTSSIVQVGGGVIWAGKQGIYYFDGATVRNFTPEALGVYYTDGIKNFDLGSDRVYAFVFNNYLVMSFTKWFSNYTLKRWQGDGSFVENDSTYTSITNTGNVNSITPDRITLAIYLPTGSIGTLSNFTPRGYMEGIMAVNQATNNISPPYGNTGTLMDLKSIFTENIDDQTLDGGSVPYWSNDTVYSTVSSGFGIRLNGPDFYMETKQYNFGETTLRKWWRKLMFNLSVNQGSMMIEFVDINDNSLVSPVTNSDPAVYNTTDESGYYLIGSTTYPWSYYQDQGEEGVLDWDDIENTPDTWLEYFAGVNIRYSRWLGIRKSSLGFRMYCLRGYDPDTLSVIGKAYAATNEASVYFSAAPTGISVGDMILVNINDAAYDGLHRVIAVDTTSPGFSVTYNKQGAIASQVTASGSVAREVTPEIVNVNDWIWGLKPLRSGRN